MGSPQRSKALQSGRFTQQRMRQITRQAKRRPPAGMASVNFPGIPKGVATRRAPPSLDTLRRAVDNASAGVPLFDHGLTVERIGRVYIFDG